MFKKGQSGNPKGRPKTTGALQDFRKLSYEDFINKLQKYGAFTNAQMKAELQRSDLTMFESMFAQIVVKASAGDKDARSVILERLWGRVFYKADFFNEANPNGTDASNGMDVDRTEIVVYIPSNGREVVDKPT